MTTTHNSQPSRLQARPLLLLASGLALAAAILYRYPPSASTFYPQCPVWTLLHLQCPGCGSTRAFAALLHGRFAEALRWNALTVCGLPALLAYCLISAIPRQAHSPESSPAFASRRHLPAIYAGLVVAAAFTIVRNL